ncbi:MAG: VOC family protein [Hyphococcus sp.]
MEKVTGIGGLFFRAKDPDKLAKWYADNLGVDLVPTSYDVEPWKQEAGPTVFSPFAADTKYFGPDMNQQWMINFRVRDLDAMVAQLRANGNEVEVNEEDYPNGRFARVYDPEGTPVELWEPAGGDSH